jgi:hypothetical protein
VLWVPQFTWDIAEKCGDHRRQSLIFFERHIAHLKNSLWSKKDLYLVDCCSVSRKCQRYFQTEFLGKDLCVWYVRCVCVCVCVWVFIDTFKNLTICWLFTRVHDLVEWWHTHCLFSPCKLCKPRFYIHILQMRLRNLNVIRTQSNRSRTEA